MWTRAMSSSVWEGITPLSYQPTDDPRDVLAKHAKARAWLASKRAPVLEQEIKDVERCSQAVTDSLTALQARRTEEKSIDSCQAVTDRIAALRARRPEEGIVPLINSSTPPVLREWRPEDGRNAKYDDWVTNRLALLPARSRVEARRLAGASSDKTYVGRVHAICKTSLRYTKGDDCVHCSKQALKLERQRRDADDVLALNLMKAARAAKQKQHDDWVKQAQVERAARDDFIRAEARARELCIAAGLDPDGRRGEGRGHPIWTEYRDAARKEANAAEQARLASEIAAMTVTVQTAEFADAPLTIMGE